MADLYSTITCERCRMPCVVVYPVGMEKEFEEACINVAKKHVCIEERVKELEVLDKKQKCICNATPNVMCSQHPETWIKPEGP